MGGAQGCGRVCCEAGNRCQDEVPDAERIKGNIGRVDTTHREPKTGASVLVESLDVEPFPFDEELARRSGPVDVRT